MLGNVKTRWRNPTQPSNPCLCRRTSFHEPDFSEMEKKEEKLLGFWDVRRTSWEPAGLRFACWRMELYGRANNSVSAPSDLFAVGGGERTSSSLDSRTTALCLGADRPVTWVCVMWSASRFPQRLLAPGTCSVKQSVGVGDGISTSDMGCGAPSVPQPEPAYGLTHSLF